jgi:hypothetical protein
MLMLVQLYTLAVRYQIATKEVDMNGIGDVMKGGISAILISLGYVLLQCGIFCLIGFAMGGTMGAGDPKSILWCGSFCIILGLIQIGSGIAWYNIVKPKSQT